jgi:AcrR family transcriptional regulator
MLTLSTLFCHNFSVTAPAAAKPRKYHHGNLRETLIEAGLALIAEKGVRALTLREIGARAGVSRMAAYRHFKNKEELLFAIGEAGFKRFGDALQQACDEAGSTYADRILAMGLAYLEFATRNRAHFEVMFLPVEDPSCRPANGTETARRAFGILEHAVREGQAAGDVEQGDSQAIASLIWSSIHGISLLKLAREGPPDAFGPEFVRFLSQVLYRGLKPQ